MSATDPRSETARTIAVNVFEVAIDHLGDLAQQLAHVVDEKATALGRIEAQGNRIDRLIADNEEILLSLQRTVHG